MKQLLIQVYKWINRVRIPTKKNYYVIEELRSDLLPIIEDESGTVILEQKFHVLLEEAHRYVQNDNDNYLLGYNIFERIAKEGRKFGMVMDLITQRPTELSETVLSQCSNFIIFKLNHPTDLEYIRKMVPNISADVIEKQKSFSS